MNHLTFARPWQGRSQYAVGTVLTLLVMIFAQAAPAQLN